MRLGRCVNLGAPSLTKQGGAQSVKKNERWGFTDYLSLR